MTARRLAAVAASDVGGLRTNDPRRGAVAGPPHVPGRRVQFFHARYAGTASVLWAPPWAASWVWGPRGPPAGPLSCRDGLPAGGARGPLAHARHGPGRFVPCDAALGGRARGGSGVLLLCPSGAPASPGTPCRLACASAAVGGLHPRSSPHHTPAAGRAEGPPPLPLAPSARRHRSARRMEQTRAPACASPSVADP